MDPQLILVMGCGLIVVDDVHDFAESQVVPMQPPGLSWEAGWRYSESEAGADDNVFATSSFWSGLGEPWDWLIS